MKIGIFTILFFSLIASTLGDNSADASTIMKANLDQVAKESELIFEGRAVSKETRPSPISGKPFTYFTFDIIDLIKGSYSNPTIEIGFMGGTLGNITLEVSDMRMPEIGERGIYFVENIGEQQIHPLFGWQQGHYLLDHPQRVLFAVAGKVADVHRYKVEDVLFDVAAQAIVGLPVVLAQLLNELSLVNRHFG